MKKIPLAYILKPGNIIIVHITNILFLGISSCLYHMNIKPQEVDNLAGWVDTKMMELLVLMGCVMFLPQCYPFFVTVCHITILYSV